MFKLMPFLTLPQPDPKLKKAKVIDQKGKAPKQYDE
jgi:hypothetical protein